MPQSQRFRILKTELNQLRKYLLPRKFDPLGLYTERQLTYATAYRVLVHAEIEAYLEDRVKEVAKNAIDQWKTKGKISRSLFCLFAFSGIELPSPPKSLGPSQPNQKKHDDLLQLDQKIGKVYGKFLASVDNNHGIKEINLLALLLPIGINSNDLDPAWINFMNEFGKQRGLVAHTSASSYKTKQPIDPKQEFDTVDKIVNGFSGIQGLVNIDQLLNDLMS